MSVKLKYSLGIIFTTSLIVYGLISFFLTRAVTLENNIPASYVIGAGSSTQDFTNNSSGLTSSALDYPQDVLFDQNNNRLFIVEEDNRRVLIFNTGVNGVPLDYVADYNGAIAIILEKGCKYGADVLEQIKKNLGI